MKISFLMCMFIVLGGCVTAQNYSAQQITATLNSAFKQKSDSVLRQVTHQDFSIATYVDHLAVSGLVTVLNNYACDSVLLHKSLNGNKHALVFYKTGKVDTTVMHLAANGKLLRIDLFDELYGMFRNSISKRLVSIPFEDVNGSIMLNVKINKHGKTLRLLFDTGSDGMMVDKATATEIGLLTDKKQQAMVVGGNIDLEISSNNTVLLDTFPVSDQSIAIFDNGGFGDHNGIIGNTLAKKYIVEVNYDTKTLSLYSFGSSSAPQNSVAVPVKALNGALQMNALLNMKPGKPVNATFIFDTGAEYHLIVFRPLVRKHKLLVDGFVADSTGSTLGLGIASPVFYGRSSSFQLLPDLVVDKMPVALMGGAASNANWNPAFDGSVGTKFISQYNFIINLMDQKIYLNPNSKFENKL